MSVKGDVPFKVGETEYTLRFSIDAICALEDAAGKGFIALTADMQNVERMSMGLVRKVLWAGLREHHPDITLKQAGDLIIPAGGMQKVLGYIEVAFVAAFPEAKAEEEVRPPTPGQGGTGSAS